MYRVGIERASQQVDGEAPLLWPYRPSVAVSKRKWRGNCCLQYTSATSRANSERNKPALYSFKDQRFMRCTKRDNDVRAHSLSTSNLNAKHPEVPENFEEKLDKLASSSQQLDNQRMSAKIDVEKVNILCLSSDTGGGHRASAQALHDSCVSIYGDEFNFNIVDLWSNNSPWPFSSMPKSYFFLVKHPWLWRLNFRCSEPAFVHEVMFKGYAAIVARRFKQAFMDYRPHLVVSVHPLMQHVPLKVLTMLKYGHERLTPAFATVVTDLTRCHSTWFHKDVDRCFVANGVVASQARERNLSDDQITCHGLPIRPAFGTVSAQANKLALRSKLGLDTHASTVMLIGGGEGMGKIAAITEALSRRLSVDDQLIVICGRNQSLASKLTRRKWDTKVVVKGFINNMAEYMAACDCVITKAGPGTIAEALTCGLPIILNGCIPCQEEGNIPYVLENGVGVYSENPEEIAETVAQWFGPLRSKLVAMSARSKALGRPEATNNIVRDLAEMARRRGSGCI